MFALDATDAIADFVVAHLGLQPGRSSLTEDPDLPC
jgi:hypothetical protein